jgi:hypothetical protein
MENEPSTERSLFEARLAEHISARDELIGAISNQHLVLTFGTASIVGVFVAGFLTWEDSVNWAVFFAIPPISAWVLAMWLAEVVRMIRAVAFCSEQASVINASLGMSQIDNPPIRWEAWREEDRDRTIRWSYISVVVALFGTYLIAIPFGLGSVDWSPGWKVLVAFAFVLGLGALIGAVAVVFRRWTRLTSRIGVPSGQ